MVEPSTLSVTSVMLAKHALAYAAKHPDKVASNADKLRTLFQFRKPNVFVTGAKGAGKTVLCDYLTGSAYREGYEPPTLSANKEKYTLPRDGKAQALRLTTILGEESLPRQVALGELLKDKRLTGVVHVLCAGYSRPRASYVDLVLDQVKSPEALRVVGESTETRDLKDTLSTLRQHWQRWRQPFWLLIVGAKYDLYAGESDSDKILEMDPNRDGRVGKVVDVFRRQVGTDNIDIHFQLAAAWLSDFEWKKECHKSALGPNPAESRQLRDIYIGRLRERIRALTEGSY